MAVAVTEIASNPLAPGATPPGQLRTVYKKITFDASYPTGGYSIKPGDLGFQMSILFLDPNLGDSAHLPVWNVATQKLQLFTAQGTEVSNATDLHTNFCYAQAWGI